MILMRVLGNDILNAAMLSWVTAQLIKVILNSINEKKIDFERFFGSGGMPSSHCATVTGLTTAVGLSEGISSPFFAICVVFTLIVTYDASGVRRAAGEHAKAINKIAKDFEIKNVEIIDEQLKELLGHNKIEVIAGSILGISIAVIYWLFSS